MPIAPSRQLWPRLVLSVPLALSLALGGRTLHASDDASISLEADEIGYDAREQAFSAPLPYGKEFKVVLIEPAGSSARLTVTRSLKGGCTDGDAVAELASTPTGPVVDAKQKLAFKAPKLWPMSIYCFKVDVTRKRALAPEEISAFGEAMTNAVAHLTSDEYKDSDYDAACKALGSKEKPAPNNIRRCGVADAITREAPPSLRDALIYDRKRKQAVSLREALYSTLSDRSSTQLLSAIQAAVDAVVDARFAKANLAGEITNVRNALSATSDRTQRVYDPLPSVDSTAFCNTLSLGDPNAKKIQGDICKLERTEFVSALYARRLELTPAGPGTLRSILAAPGEAELQAFFSKSNAQGPIESKVVRDTGEQLALTFAGEASVRENSGAVEALDARLPLELKDWVDVAYPIAGGRADKLQALLRLRVAVNNVATSVKSIALADKLKTAISKEPAVQAFLKDTYSDQVWLGDHKPRRATVGQTQDRFPYYVSLDVGAGAFAFSSSTWDIAQYVGVNVYTGPVDPDEPLYGPTTGHWLRKAFSFTAGLTTTSPRGGGDKGVSGVIGEQLALLGAGLRVLEFVRLSGGMFLFKQEDPNPVVKNDTLQVGSYVGLSFDVAAFELIGKAFSGGSS